MAFTQSDIDTLDEQYKLGAKKVKTSDGQELELRSLDEYLRHRALMITEVRGAGRKPSSWSVARVGR